MVKKGREKKFQGRNPAGMCFCISDDKNLNLILSSLQNLGFAKSTKNSMWFVDTMLKSVKKYQDGSYNSHWNIAYLGGQDEYILFSTASLWDKPKQVWRSG